MTSHTYHSTIQVVQITVNKAPTERIIDSEKAPAFTHFSALLASSFDASEKNPYMLPFLAKINVCI